MCKLKVYSQVITFPDFQILESQRLISGRADDHNVKSGLQPYFIGFPAVFQFLGFDCLDLAFFRRKDCYPEIGRLFGHPNYAAIQFPRLSSLTRVLWLSGLSFPALRFVLNRTNDFRRGLAPRVKGSESLPDDLHQDSFAPPPVELAVEELLPRTEI